MTTPPAPGRAETISDEQLDALEEMAATVAVKGPLLRELIAEVRANRRPAPAIVAEVPFDVKRYEISAGWTTPEMCEAIGDVATTVVLASDYDAALRSLAEVRERLAAARECNDNGVAELAAATQRAEKAETAIKAAYNELGGIGPQSSLSFHRIGIDSARGILGRALPAPACGPSDGQAYTEATNATGEP